MAPTAKIHSTNPIERLNGGIKRRTDVAGTLPNEAAVTRLVGAIPLEQYDAWATPRARNMTLETIVGVSDAPTLACPPWPLKGGQVRRGAQLLHCESRHDFNAPTGLAELPLVPDLARDSEAK